MTGKDWGAFLFWFVLPMIALTIVGLMANGRN